MKLRKVLFRQCILWLGLVGFMLSFTQAVSASSTLPAKQLTVTKPATISSLSYATNQLVQQVLSTPVVNTAQKAADLSQSIGTTVSTPATVVVDPSVTSAGTVVDETKTPAVSSTTSPTTNNLLASISPNQDPKIDGVKVSGSVNNDMTGSGVLDNLEVTIDSKNITPNNLLTPDGLHWSDDTTVVPIRGTALGTISSANFGVDGPTIPATAYSFNPGDSGRITDVGQTLSGLKLDLLYTVVSNDAPAWQVGFTDPDPTTPQGLAFTGEQNINGADGNSIVALYYGTNQLDILYQVVLSGTVIEAPVLASFISTDIDNGQGVTTNLNNILTVTPNTTNLQDDGKIKYDTTNQNLNGASSLPYGGYLGVGFVSHFDYHFYSPAPVMSGTSLAYSAGVRYDLFGSSLQAHLITQTRVHGQIFYYDNQNNQFHNTDNFIWFPDTDVNIPMSHFDNYAQDSWEETGAQNHPVLNWHYTKLSTVTINFYGTNGVYLGSNSDTERAGTPYSFDAPNHIAYYDLIGNGHYSGTFGMTDQTINVYYNYNPPVIQVTREVTEEVPNPNYNPDIVAAMDYEAEQAAYLAANPWAGPSAHMSWEQYVSKSGMATFSTYAAAGDPGSVAWYEYYAYYAEPTIEQKVVERYFTVDNGQLTPKPVSADTGGAGNFNIDRNPNKPKNWWDKAVQGTQNFFKGVGHAIGSATKAVGQAIGAGLDWLNQTVVSPVVDFVKKNATALAVAGLTLTTIGLTIANVVQVGADPATDALEVGDLGLLGEKIGQMTEEDSAAGEKISDTASEVAEKSSDLTNKDLLNQIEESGAKYNPDDVVMTVKNSDGKLMWLENGNSRAGLEHILEEHEQNFIDQGISPNEIPSFLKTTIQESPIETGVSKAGPYAIYLVDGQKYTVAYGDNGYIVSFFPSK